MPGSGRRRRRDMADSIRTLREMGFGSHGNNFLQKALDSHAGDLEWTVEALLNGWTGKPESDSRKSKGGKKKGSQSTAKHVKSQPRPPTASSENHVSDMV